MDKVIFWDFDGTLAMSPNLWCGSLHQALVEILPECNITLEEVRRYTRSGFTWDTPEQDYTKLIGDKWWEHMFVFFDEIYEKVGIPVEFRRTASRLAMEKIQDVRRYRLYEDAEVTLRKISAKGYHNYILSNHIPELWDIVMQLGIAQYFTGCIISSQVGYDKPRPEIFEYASKSAGYPKNAYMIGDNPVADILGGKAAGMKAILVHRTVVCQADAVCENLHDIIDILD